MKTGPNAPRRLSIFGSTGSIGVNTLDVVTQLGGREAFEVVAISGNANVALLAEQAKACGAELAVTADEASYGALKDALSGTGIEVAGRPEDGVMVGEQSLQLGDHVDMAVAVEVPAYLLQRDDVGAVDAGDDARQVEAIVETDAVLDVVADEFHDSL